MGISVFNKSCFTNADACAPNPSRYQIISSQQFENAYILKVRYPDCTNFEGIKILVYEGQLDKIPDILDPHFSEEEKSPIARFKPTQLGMMLARKIAGSL